MQSDQLTLDLPSVPLWSGTVADLRNSKLEDEICRDENYALQAGMSVPDLGRAWFGTRTQQFCPRFHGSVDPRPIRRIGLAMLDQAKVDLTSPLKKRYGEALYWLNEGEAGFPLENLAALLGVSCKGIRQKIAEHIHGYECRGPLQILYRVPFSSTAALPKPAVDLEPDDEPDLEPEIESDFELELDPELELEEETQ